MRKKTIDEINKHTNPDSFLVVGKDGRLHRVHVPFKVKVYLLIGEYKVGQVLEVGKIKCSHELKVIYFIEGRSYNHRYFQILL